MEVESVSGAAVVVVGFKCGSNGGGDCGICMPDDPDESVPDLSMQIRELFVPYK